MGHEFLGPSMRVSGGEGCGLGGSHKETELRLGLPGLESPERPEKAVTGLGFALGAKRGFLDTVGGSSKWAFAGGNGSEMESGKNCGLVRLENGMKSMDCSGLAAKGGSVEEQNSPAANEHGMVPASKAQVVGWPPVRNYRNRKNTMTSNPSKNDANTEEKQMPGCVFVKVSMDGAPYLRKINLKTYCNYKELSGALKKMFSCFTIGQCDSHVSTPSKDGHKEGRLADGSEYVLTYEDKDGDWMLVGDVPWKMFIETCRKLRIMKGSDAIGLAPPVTDKCESRN